MIFLLVLKYFICPLLDRNSQIREQVLIFSATLGISFSTRAVFIGSKTLLEFMFCLTHS